MARTEVSIPDPSAWAGSGRIPRRRQEESRQPSKRRAPAVAFRIQRLRSQAAGTIPSGGHRCRDILEKTVTGSTGRAEGRRTTASGTG